MKLTEKLLEKYFLGKCTEEEKEFMEKWVNSLSEEDPELSLSDLQEMKKNSWNVIKERNQFSSVAYKSKRKNAALYRRVLRYSAAACLLIGLFYAGRLSNPNIENDTQSKLSGMLHIYGGDRSYAQAEGERYNVLFDGALQLFNESNEVKTVFVGDKEYKIKPLQNYFLTGSNHNSHLVNTYSRENNKHSLKGNFTVKIIRGL